MIFISDIAPYKSMENTGMFSFNYYQIFILKHSVDHLVNYSSSNHVDIFIIIFDQSSFVVDNTDRICSRDVSNVFFQLLSNLYLKAFSGSFELQF